MRVVLTMLTVHGIWNTILFYEFFLSKSLCCSLIFFQYVLRQC